MKYTYINWGKAVLRNTEINKNEAAKCSKRRGAECGFVEEIHARTTAYQFG
jgi:hypothetical protein